jgi:hypothetical protein
MTVGYDRSMRSLLVVLGVSVFTLLCGCGPSSSSAPPPASANGAATEAPASTAAPASTGCSCKAAGAPETK